MKKLFVICLFILAVPALGQEEIAKDSAVAVLEEVKFWDSELSVGFNFNQAAFSGNWKAGGVNSVAFASLVTGRANYTKGKYSWINQLELIYGLVRNEGQDLRKSNDRIFLDSKMGYKVSKKWGYFGSVNFITQFTDGFNYSGDDPVRISGFFSPAFLTTGIGMEYIPNEAFNLRIAPFSPRFTFVTDPTIADNVPTNYGVPLGSKVRTEWLASQLFMSYKKSIAENLTLNARYQLFANFETLAFKNIDHRLDLTIAAKITKFVDVTFTSINVYDIDMDSKIQFSQALALGILYKMNNKK
jgi:putative salt-induced outer membrane protein YdiY